MIDVSQKSITTRIATAECTVHFPLDVYETIKGQNFNVPKGDLFATAKIAGIMAVKNTPLILPLCHPLLTTKAELTFTPDEQKQTVRVECLVKCDGKTGVEMEALTGANAAALCLYDMTKMYSHDIKITNLQLVGKSGGKRNFDRYGS